MSEVDFSDARRAMVASQLRTNAVTDPRVLDAMGTVPRDAYVPEARRGLAYLDVAVPLGEGRAMPAPLVLGRLLTEARVKASDRALVIGAGAGYAAAVLALLAGQVIALDDRTLAPVRDDAVEPVRGPLAAGWPEAAPYDLILIDGAVEEVPAAIVDQLADGGRLATAIDDRGVTRLAIGRKAGRGFGLVPFADAEAPVLPGFARTREFSF